MQRLFFSFNKNAWLRAFLWLSCLITLWLYQHYFILLHIKSGSMEPGLPTFCKILVSRATQNYSRWDAIAFRHPLRLQEIQVKRIVGLPGERIRVLDGNLYHHSTGEWRILTKPSWLQEQGQFWNGHPIFEEIRYYRQTFQKNQINWVIENRWKGWDFSPWEVVGTEPIAYRGQGTILYTLPSWAIFERPGGVRSDQPEKIKVLERPNAEVRFRLKFQTRPPFSGRIQEAQHEICFQVGPTELELSVSALWKSSNSVPLIKKIPLILSDESSISLEFGHYDDFAFVVVNGNRLELSYSSDPFQEKSEAQLQFHFDSLCTLQEPIVEMDNAYKEEMEGTIDASLKSIHPAEYFVCGDNTLTGRIPSDSSSMNQPPLDLGLSNDSRTWEKIVVTRDSGQIDSFEDRMEDLPLYQPGQSRFGPKIDFGVCDPGLPESAILGKVLLVLPETFSQFYVLLGIFLLFLGFDFFCFSEGKKFICRYLKPHKNDLNNCEK